MQQPSGRVARLRAALESAVDTVASVEEVRGRTRITAVVGPDVTPTQYGEALALVQGADRWGSEITEHQPVIWAEFDERGSAVAR